MIFDGIREFARKASELGLTMRTLRLPSPTLALLPSPDNSELTDDLIFERLITEPEIYAVSHDLFVGQFYNNSVQEALTALDNYIKVKVGKTSPSGAKLMREVFDTNSPLLAFSGRTCQSEKDEQEGYGLSLIHI